MKSKGLMALMLAAILVTPILAQDEDPPAAIEESEDGWTFSVVKEGISFDDFVEYAARATGKTFVYDSRRLGATKMINMVGTKTVPKEELFSFLQVLFYAHDMAVVPIGTPETEVLLIEDIKTSQQLKQRAVFVDYRDLEVRRSRVGEIIATTIPLQHIPVEKAQRALNNIIQEHRAGFVQPIEESNSLLITNFAPTVWTMYQIIVAMDVPIDEQQLEFEKLSLEYHVAEELAPIIESLIEVRTDISSSGGARPAPGGNRAAAVSRPGGGSVPAPRIIPDARTGSLLVYATPEFMAEIKMLVASLDSEVTEPNSNIHIYELKNTNAEDIQDVLTQLLQDGSRRSARPSGTGGRGRTAAGANTAGATNSTDPDFVNIVADPNTNSLLITATRQRFDEIAEIVERLDQRRPQVLVQAAIAELSDNDLENIGVELLEAAGTMDGVFGGSSFGLSTIDTRGNINGGTDGMGGDGSGTGGGTGGSGSTGSGDQFFSDLVRIPNLDAAGFTGGIFRNFLEVPVLVQLFKQVVKGNLVSVPSILVNDNQEARIVVGNEIPTTSVNQGQFSDQTSFQGYQEANLELVISPTISNDNYLRLEVSISIAAFTGSQIDPSIPPPRTNRELTTNITLQSGRTVVIGGLTTDNYRETVNGIPLLMDIPFLGYLFRSSSTTRDRTTLYVFITPTILDEFEALERLSYERKLEIAKLDGQITMVDPHFRELDLDDEDLDIEEIESTGHLDVLHYRPTAPMEDPDVRTPGADGVPIKPKPVAPRTEAEMNRPGSSRAIVPDESRSGESSRGKETRTIGDSFGRRRPGARPQPADGGL